jgi:hypothetical protein
MGLASLRGFSDVEVGTQNTVLASETVGATQSDKSVGWQT